MFPPLPSSLLFSSLLVAATSLALYVNLTPKENSIPWQKKLKLCAHNPIILHKARVINKRNH